MNAVALRKAYFDRLAFEAQLFGYYVLEKRFATGKVQSWAQGEQIGFEFVPRLMYRSSRAVINELYKRMAKEHGPGNVTKLVFVNGVFSFTIHKSFFASSMLPTNVKTKPFQIIVTAQETVPKYVADATNQATVIQVTVSLA